MWWTTMRGDDRGIALLTPCGDGDKDIIVLRRWKGMELAFGVLVGVWGEGMEQNTELQQSKQKRIEG